MRAIRILFACFTWMLACGAAGAEEVQVAVAANFTAPMKEITAAFETETGHKALLSFGATGTFFAQIRNGAPYDILLAADSETVDRLDQEGATVPESHFTYAQGQLVLWSATPGYVESGEGALRSGFKHLAIADPALAPYGRAAQEVLANMGLWDDLEEEKRLVVGMNIGQAHQFVKSGNAELGFVAMSQIYKEGVPVEGSYWVVPDVLYSPIVQDAAILKKAAGNRAARELVEFLKADKAREIIKSYGYML